MPLRIGGNLESGFFLADTALPPTLHRQQIVLLGDVLGPLASLSPAV
jgi:hypothetical protein